MLETNGFIWDWTAAGGAVISFHASRPIGCYSVKYLTNTVAERKRLYVTYSGTVGGLHGGPARRGLKRSAGEVVPEIWRFCAT